MHPDFDLSRQIRRFEDQYARNPGSLIFARLADLHRKAGSPRRALEVLDEGLERHPEYLSAHIVRARTLQALDRTEKAEAAYHRVLALDRQNLVALRALAELARERGDLSDARERYERLLEVDPRNDRARARLRELRGAGAPSRPTPTPGPGPGDRVEPAEDREELADEVRRIVADVRERFGGRGEDEGKEPDASEQRDASEEAPDAEEAPDVPGAGSDAGPTSAGRADDADDAVDADDPEVAGDPEADAAVAEGETAALAEEESSPGVEDERPSAVEDEPPTTPDAEAEDEGLVTETLAQLYASQGFHEEAVQMYEEMVRERSDDPDLRARLEAVRARARGEEPEEPPPPLERAERRSDGGRVDDASGGSGRGSLDGGPLSATGAVDGDGPTERVRAKSPVPAEAPTPTARQHLRALLRGEAIPGYANQLLREARGDVDGED